MNVRTLKRYVLPNLHYVFLWWLFDKVGEAYRTAYGADKLKKLIGAAAIYLTVLYKKHKKKWRKDIEYGSARWGNKSDIAPYVDPKPDSNIILTAMESLTLNGRPKNPKYARNKNVMIVGGSGSGKTRFWLKPNLMQCHSSYCVTDPKGLIC